MTATGLRTAPQRAPASAAAPDQAPRGQAVTAHVDLRRALANIQRFHTAASGRGVAVRAHAKGHRTLGLAVRQIEAGAVGISVTQAGQARRYVEAGITDIVIAHPYRETWRFPLYADLARDCTVALHVDTPQVLGPLAAAARAAGSTIGVLARIGDGYDATASRPDDLLALARTAERTPGLRFDGLTSYQGMLAPGDGRNRFDIGARTAHYAVRCADFLRAHGVAVPTVSVGGTPTAAGILSVPGVTELGSGAYALYDAGLVEAGVCTEDDVALTVSLRRGASSAAAESLLAEHRYPWQHRGPVLPSEYEVTGPVPVPHLCPLLQEVPVLQVRAASGRVQQWPVLATPDTAPVDV